MVAPLLQKFHVSAACFCLLQKFHVSVSSKTTIDLRLLQWLKWLGKTYRIHFHCHFFNGFGFLDLFENREEERYKYTQLSTTKIHENTWTTKVPDVISFISRINVRKNQIYSTLPDYSTSGKEYRIVIAVCFKKYSRNSYFSSAN